LTENEIKLHIAKSNIGIVEAMQMIQNNLDGIVFIVDDSDKLLGSVTDGDIRRWLIRTGDINANVAKVMFQGTRFIYESKKNYALQFMKENKILAVPIVSNELRIRDIIINTDIMSWRKNSCKDVLRNITIIIMAGGEGTRLQPYTKILPKPLIPIDGIPILERIINKFGDYGAHQFYITLNYKKEMIKAYFTEQHLPYEINFIEENKPLGTAGSIRLIKERLSSPIIITNCDILIEADYADMVKHHIALENDMTIIASLKKTIIPYGVLHSHESGLLTSMDEKPEISYLINTGMYIINPSAIKMIPEKQIFHMPWLAQKLIDLQRRVGMYPIGENSFLDMGQFEEMKKMEERISSGAY